jgi:hypothetical protein
MTMRTNMQTHSNIDMKLGAAIRWSRRLPRQFIQLAMLTMAALLLTISAPAIAAPVLVTDRTTLAGTDYIDWGTLGPSGTDVSNPFDVTSNGGVTFNVSKPLAGDFEIRQQSSTWVGNFAPDDMLLWTNNLTSTTSNPISFFDTGGGTIFAAGAQIQANFHGAFVAFIEIFDVLNNSIAMFTLAGNASGSGDNSTIFIGISDPNGFSSVSIGLTSAIADTIGDFAINQFDFTMARQPTAVPAPGALALIGVGLLGLALIRRRRLA